MSRAVARAAALLVVALGGGSCGEETSRPSNVLLITIDTLRADHLGAYGYDRPTSPHLDRLLERSVVFEDAMSSSSWTLPALASLFTSLHSSTHGCFDYRSRLPDSFTTLAEILAGHGFRTLGVVSHVFLRPSHGLPQGFEELDASLVSDVAEAHRTISSPYVTERALEHLEALAAAGSDGAEARPWLLWLHYFDPHVAYQLHEGVTGRFGKEPVDRYDGEIAFTDRHVGAVLRRLEELGLADDTVVVVHSDHGEEFEEHGRHGHGKSLFGEVVRVPLAFRVPGLPPRRVKETVHLVDVAPTLLELLDVPWPAELPRHGRSLVPALRGERLPDVPALSELRLPLRDDATLASVVFDRWRLVVERSRPPETGERVLLFDRRADPEERTDVAGHRPKVVQRLRKWLLDLERSADRDRRLGEATTPLSLDERELESLRELGYVSGPDDDG